MREEDHHPPAWTVLLIGGSSGTGKTSLARALGRHYGVSVLHMDDVRLAVEQTTTAAHHPALHRFSSDPAIWSDAGTVRDALIAVAERLEPALAIIVANHLDQPEMGPIIIEGDSVLPRVANPAYAATLPQLADIPLAGRVRVLCLREGEEAALFAALRARERGFARFTPEEQHIQARGKWLYSAWLRAEAERYGVPSLPARSYRNAVERALALLDG